MKNLLFPLLCLIALAIGCKKSDSPSICEDSFGDGDCFLDFEEMLVETFLYGGGYSDTYTYDSEARLVQISASDVLLTYDYSMPDKVLSQLIYIQPGQPNDTTQRVFLLENGLTAQYIKTRSDGTVSIRVYDRNQDGTINKESYFDGNSQLQSYIEYEYDADGNETVARYKDKNGLLQIALTSAYGPGAPQNTVITGKVFWWKDQPKKPTQTVETDYSNPVSPQVTTTNLTYELDEHGRIVKETQYTGTAIYVTRFVYKI